MQKTKEILRIVVPAIMLGVIMVMLPKLIHATVNVTNIGLVCMDVLGLLLIIGTLVNYMYYNVIVLKNNK